MWFGRRRRLLDIRQAWARPIARQRRRDAMAASHAARCATLGTRALDARTWTDLDMDDVFVAIDRTTSTLGQHALYHRLRTAPVGEHLAEFEALVERMRASDAGRERAQLALSRLQDPHGYDVWWLGAADALVFDAWHFGDSIGPDGLAFDHRLRHGPATSRNAIALLRLSGAPESLVDRATKSADRLDRERGVTVVRR